MDLAPTDAPELQPVGTRKRHVRHVPSVLEAEDLLERLVQQDLDTLRTGNGEVVRAPVVLELVDLERLGKGYGRRRLELAQVPDRDARGRGWRSELVAVLREAERVDRVPRALFPSQRRSERALTDVIHLYNPSRSSEREELSVGVHSERSKRRWGRVGQNRRLIHGLERRQRMNRVRLVRTRERNECARRVHSQPSDLALVELDDVAREVLPARAVVAPDTGSLIRASREEHTVDRFAVRLAERNMVNFLSVALERSENASGSAVVELDDLVVAASEEQ